MIRLGEARMNVLNFPVKDWIADTPTRAYMAFDAFVRAKKLAERARERYYAMRDRQTPTARHHLERYEYWSWIADKWQLALNRGLATQSNRAQYAELERQKAAVAS